MRCCGTLAGRTYESNIMGRLYMNRLDDPFECTRNIQALPNV